MAAKLPMPVRKNIKDSEPARDKHLAEIVKIVGYPLAFVPNFEANYEKFEGGRKEKIGEIYHDELLGEIVNLLRSNLSDPLIKEAFNATVTKKEIRFTIGKIEKPTQSTYNDVYFEDGALVLKHNPEPMCVPDIGQFKFAKVRGLNQGAGGGKLPVAARQSLQKNDAKKVASIDRISKATGVKWTFDEASLEPVWEEYERNAEWGKYKDSWGAWFYEGLEYLAQNIETIVKDDMVKDGLNETFPKHEIAFKIVRPLDKYWVPAAQDGKLILQFKDLACFSDLAQHDGGFNIVKIL